jgi:hypothetical protein
VFTRKFALSSPRRTVGLRERQDLDFANGGGGGTVEEVAAESVDLLYHLLVLLKVRGIPLERVIAELKARHTARS